MGLLNGSRRSDKAEREDDDEDEEEEGHEEPMHIDDGGDELEIMDQEEEEDDGMDVLIDRTRMRAMVNKLVKVTKGYNVQEMEEKMYHLLRTVYRHSNQWDKSEMMEELKHVI